jgi:hypothetical protein
VSDEGRDWYEVVFAGAPCPDCGLDVGEVAVADLAPAVLGEARRWEDLLGELAEDDAALRRRPSPDVWSAIEYAGHVAGTLDVFSVRVRRVREEERPELGWWDHETAVEEGRFAVQPAGDVRAAIADGAVSLALSLPRVDDRAAWQRIGTRRGAEVFTIEGLVRFVVHESTHHRDDAVRSWRSAGGRSG